MKNLISIFLAAMIYCFPVVLQASESSDGVDFRHALAGNTASIITITYDLALGYFTADGGVRGVIGGKKFIGKWDMRSERKLCLKLSNEIFDVCYFVSGSGANISLTGSDGKAMGRFEILIGNPYRF